MHCDEARESILDSLLEPLARERLAAMETHIAECETCAAFASAQRSLDTRLSTAMAAACLSPEFRTSLKTAIRRETSFAWPDFLPDLAHLVGCLFAIGILVVVLPQFGGSVIAGGAAFTAVTYFLQGLVRSSLESIEGDA
jgi:hypothetical protein